MNPSAVGSGKKAGGALGVQGTAATYSNVKSSGYGQMRPGSASRQMPPQEKPDENKNSKNLMVSYSAARMSHFNKKDVSVVDSEASSTKQVQRLPSDSSYNMTLSTQPATNTSAPAASARLPVATQMSAMK